MKTVFERVEGSGKKSVKSVPGVGPVNLGSLHVAAGASLVNRTHRIVRERARQMTARRDRIRSLMVPLAVSAALLLILGTAVWTLFDEYELAPNGAVNRSELVLLLWFLPLSVALLGMVWFTRIRGRRSRSELAR
jgi:hypothetical protein